MFSPQRMLSPQTMLLEYRMLPPRTLSPQTMFCAQVSDVGPIAVEGTTLRASHHEPTGCEVSIARARSMAPAAFTSPAPCVRWSTPGSAIAEYSSIAFTSFALSGGCGPRPLPLCASSTSATTPLTTPAAMLVPLRYRVVRPLAAYPWLVRSRVYRYEVSDVSDGSLSPGAITSGLTVPSYHDGPREL